MEQNLEFRVDHTAISVSNLDRSAKWYGIFGFQEQKRFDRPDLEVRGALLQLGDYRLELFEPYTPQALDEFRKKLDTSLTHIGPQHVALVVNDLDKAHQYLQSQGVEFVGEVTTGKTARYVFCRDPDGMLVEVKQDLR